MRVVSLRHQFMEKELIKNGIDVQVFRFGRGDRTNPKRQLQLVNFMSSLKPDIFFIWKDPFVSLATLRKINRVSKKTKIVMWYGDQRGYVVPELVKGRISYITALYITNEDDHQKRIYKAAGIRNVETLYHSFSETEFQPWQIGPSHDVFFGGSNFKSVKYPLSALRAELVNSIHQKFNLVVHGGGWPFKTQRWVLRNQYAKELRKGIMNLGINHYNIHRYYNRRLFESVACGRMHLTYYIPGMEKHFKNKKHLVWFKSVDEGLSLIKYYLKHHKERVNIAYTGRKFFIKRHSWPVRTKQLIKLFSKL